ncbi:hypothetical protein SFRURICE_004360 [Spodoptera frugiperda]|nr:hypothetical protein SFRURICE_004360 [Spodoptera frugiperda]
MIAAASVEVYKSKLLIANVTPFYPQRGRQRCTLRHLMPLYNVHPLFTIFCVIDVVYKSKLLILKLS